MKCVFCGAWTEVREIRHRKDGTARRTRVCANTHTFTTEEKVFLSIKGRKPAGGHAARAAAIDLDRRHARIQADLQCGLSILAVCEKWGVSRRTAQRVKAGMASSAVPTRSQKMREAGYTRRPTAKSLPSDE